MRSRASSLPLFVCLKRVFCPFFPPESLNIDFMSKFNHKNLSDYLASHYGWLYLTDPLIFSFDNSFPFFKYFFQILISAIRN